MKKERPRMPLGQRAKQFMPFKAVSGLDEALRRKEAEMEEAAEKGLMPDPGSVSRWEKNKK